MIKIKLIESRTLPVPDNLVDSITKIYRGAFIKLVVDFIEGRTSTKLKPTIRDKYEQLLDSVKEKYATELADSQSLGFVGDLNLDNVIQNGELVESVPTEQFIMALVAWPELETYLRGRMKPATFKTRLKRYFKNKGVDDIQFNIEFGKRGTTTQKDYAGLYESDIDTINITFNSSFFTSTTTPAGPAAPSLSVGSRSVEGILENIDTELEDTRTSVRHEIQHLFQNVMSSVLKAGDWQVGLPPRDVVRGASSDEERHYMDPIEMQTDIQDEVDKFVSYVKKFKEKNVDNPSIFSAAIKILLKLFIESDLTKEENKFAIDNNLKIYLTPSDLFRDIKSKDKSGKLHKYALQILYTSVSDQLQESIIMNKIKVVLTESQVIVENMTKEEIRKLIRDELEKMLKDKDIKKELGKVTKDFIKKFYKELSINSTYVVDRIDT